MTPHDGAGAREAELLLPALEEAVGWVRDLLCAGRGSPVDVRRVLAVGNGSDAVTRLLARTFPHAVTHGRADAEANGQANGRAGTEARFSGRDGAFEGLGTAELVWASGVVDRRDDQQAAVDALAASLRPGGVLAVVERGLPLRFLPRDIGIGRPGLQARLDAAAEERSASRRAEPPGSAATVEDRPAMLARAGLVPSGTRTFLTDLRAPLGLAARRHLHAHLVRLLDQVGGLLRADDRAALERLADEDEPAGILWRPDAFYLTATTVHTGRACSGTPRTAGGRASLWEVRKRP
ncbi:MULTISPECIES: class I SAM-dependent methyltransferase [Actinomadura]|uniref:SAM-dependent methyltransferase n=1 Tax=Actinomadura yumaensis TaxID=111807 RepID=A0ABW2CHL4_9ACTN|nr:class I SAM-dependent methyltransferase [Actinomadura sp. J1-007]